VSKELIIRTKNNHIEVEALRIYDTSEPIKVKAELDKEWKYYDDYAVIFKYYGYSKKVVLNKELECEIPYELLNMEVPEYLYDDKDHKRTIYAQLVGIIYSASGEYAINLKRSRIESIITIETAHKK